MDLSEKIKISLKELPRSPGIYKMKNANGEVIYIGKAKDLTKRVKQYFKENYQHSTRTKKMVSQIFEFEVISVDSELEAVILETNLIKQFKPKYNILMKDDKSYVYIKITREDFPRIQLVRKIEKDNAKYIGPKPAAHKVKETLKILKKLFPFRHCNLDIELEEESQSKDQDHKVIVTHKVIKYPCLDYFIKRCVAPCIGKVTREEYALIIKNVEDFLHGRGEDILKNLKEEMMQLAQNKQFEKAAKLRDKIAKVEEILEKQKVSDPNQENQDIVNYCITQGNAYFNLFQTREGKLIGQENFILTAEDLEDGNVDQEVLEAFLKQYYEMATDLPKEILIPHEVDNQKELEYLLEKQALRKIKLIIPQKGKKNKLLEMSLNNARIYADRSKPKWYKESDLTINAAKELQKILNLPNELKRIECYDISHLSGTDTVGSMVVFEKGAPKNAMYRKFKIRTVSGKPDDYKSMEEILYRRFSRLDNKNQNELQIKKVTKDQLEEVQQICETEDLNNVGAEYKNFQTVAEEKKIIGFAGVKDVTEKIGLVAAVWITPEKRKANLGSKLLKKTIEKSKSKRIYVVCKSELQDFYSLNGFEPIKQLPKEVSEIVNFNPDNQAIMAYDKAKHKADPSFSKSPDLIIIDGGKGQLGAATKILDQLKIRIPYISLAKRLEEIFIPGESSSLLLAKNNEALKLLQKARDEAHRFAISFNRELRSKKIGFDK